MAGEDGDVGTLARAGGTHADDAGLPPVVQGAGPPQVQEGRGVRHLAASHPLLLSAGVVLTLQREAGVFSCPPSRFSMQQGEASL